MAIGVAVDILGCTGSVEERASTLNRIILVALELKDTVGDLFAFTALMKALDLPQVRPRPESWRKSKEEVYGCRERRQESVGVRAELDGGR